MTVTRLLARPLLASTFVVGGVDSLRNAQQKAEQAKPVTDKLVPLAQKAAPQAPLPTEPTTLVRINAGVQLAGALVLATGKAPRLASAVLAASLIPTTAAGHRFWEENDPKVRANQRVHFFKNVSMLGGLLISSVDTAGKPGLAWRARHAAGDVRREARHARKDVRRQARLAAESVS